jgi:predicted permease
MDIYLKLIDVIIPVFALVGTGYYLSKKNSKLNTSFISTFTVKIGAPALSFYAITSTGISFDLFISYFFYSLLAVGGFSIIGIIFLLILKKDFIRELPPLIYPNCGNMGLPICLFAYGYAGLGVASAFSSVVILSHFTVGVFLASKKFNLKVLLESVSVYSLIIALILLYFELETPKFVENTVFLLAHATIALVLISLGVSLTRLKVFSLSNSVLLSFVRLILGPIVALLIIYFFDLRGYAAGILLIQSSMPCAILTYLIGSMYSPKKIVDNIAGTIVVSTMLSVFTIPIVIFVSLKYFA